MGGLKGSVGSGGANNRDDVVQVQSLLNVQRPAGSPALKVDGVAGPRTLSAISDFQRRRMGGKAADGLIEPGKRTWAALRGQPQPARRAATAAPADARATAAAARATTVAGDDPRLSGARWWHANQARYPNSSSVEDLESPFRKNLKAFLAALRAGGASVRVSATRRNRARAQLMHYSWKVAHGQIAPNAVPAIDGCDIEWDHGDLTTSRAAAREMVRLFHIVFKPSLTSNHIQGTAVDMTITQPSSFSIVDAGGKTVKITSASLLHQVGASYGVYKLASDPPHWSANGR